MFSLSYNSMTSYHISLAKSKIRREKLNKKLKLKTRSNI